ncbi:MAG: OmpA family protein [Deltaproteobacteria bacterium]|nr:OmpA family protein [Deltaproteobacteria bacterium]
MKSSKNFIQIAATVIFGLLLLVPAHVFCEESTLAALEEAKAAIEQARMAGAEQGAPDDLAQARSWLSQAEKRQAESRSVLSRTMKWVKSDEAAVREIMYLVSMAQVKARIAEAKSRKADVSAQLKAASKDLEDFQNSLKIMKKKYAEAEAAKAVTAKAETERQALEESRKKVAEMEAQKKKELEEAKKKKAELEALKEKELAQLKLAEERLALQKQREASKAEALKESLAAERRKLEELRQKMALLEREKAMQSDAAKIHQATVKSTDKELIITLLVINILTAGNDVSSDGEAILDQVGAFLQTHSVGSKIVVRSYTDSAGKADLNQALSEKRARTVEEYLVSHQGIPPAQISSEGYGEVMPVATNETPAGRALNRRVEIVVSK